MSNVPEVTIRLAAPSDAPALARLRYDFRASHDPVTEAEAELVPTEQVVEAMEFETADAAIRGEMMVRFTLTDAGGGTDVLVIHDNLPLGLSPADNETGWQMALDKLAAFVEAGPSK